MDFSLIEPLNYIEINELYESIIEQNDTENLISAFNCFCRNSSGIIQVNPTYGLDVCYGGVSRVGHYVCNYDCIHRFNGFLFSCPRK